MSNDKLGKRENLVVDIVLAPAWWYNNAGITFDEDFFYDPNRRVEDEKKMEQILYEKWGKYGLGKDKEKNLPVIGPVHLAAGYLISEMLGCKVEYTESAPPQVIPAQRGDLDIKADDAFESEAWKRFEKVCEQLKDKHGYLVGDVNWAGILNVAMDLRGEVIFIDMFDKPDKVHNFFGEIAKVLERFTKWIGKQTATTSISVNRVVRHFKKPLMLHSECSHTMISVDDYKKFLMKYDMEWAKKYRPYGIHFCGKDPHRYAGVFAELGELDFLDVGWGGDVAKLREKLPNKFLDIRLSPVEIIEDDISDIEKNIRELVKAAGNPQLTGVSCINMDEKVSDEKITAIFETAAKLREEMR